MNLSNYVAVSPPGRAEAPAARRMDGGKSRSETDGFSALLRQQVQSGGDSVRGIPSGYRREPGAEEEKAAADLLWQQLMAAQAAPEFMTADVSGQQTAAVSALSEAFGPAAEAVNPQGDQVPGQVFGAEERQIAQPEQPQIPARPQGASPEQIQRYARNSGETPATLVGVEAQEQGTQVSGQMRVLPARPEANGGKGEALQADWAAVRQAPQEPEGLEQAVWQAPVLSQVETVPVKVGELPVLDGEAPDLDAQLAEQVASELEAGSRRMEIRLTPEHLGRITLELTQREDGSLQVAITAGTQEGARLLEKHTAGLERLLAATQAPSVQVEVHRPPESGGAPYQHPYDREDQGGQNRQNSQQQQRRQHNEDFMQQLRLGLIGRAEAVS